MAIDEKIKVLIAEDSSFMRELAKRIISKYDDIEIIGEAKDGAEAIQMALQLKPDVITMDYNMPIYNGAEATTHILSNSESYRPGIIMLSAYTFKEAKETIQSLRAGAVDFIAKPSGELSSNLDDIEDELIQKIHAAATAQIKPQLPPLPPTITEPQTIRPNTRTELIIIGASTGGPPLIEDILIALPEDFPIPIIVCQHMPKTFTKVFAERLNNLSKIKVVEGQENEQIAAQKVIIIPGDTTPTIKDSQLKLTPTPIHSPLISIDSLMASAVEEYKDHILGILLSGMGKDGFEGIKAIKSNNGSTIAQDPQTTVIESMPTRIIEAGLADEILTPKAIKEKILSFT